MNEIFFELITPVGVLFEGNIRYLRAPGSEGEFGIYPGHVPFFTLLSEGIVEADISGKREFFLISDGVFEFHENRLMILAEEAVRGSDIDLHDEKKAEREILSRIENNGIDTDLETSLHKITMRLKTRKLLEENRR